MPTSRYVTQKRAKEKLTVLLYRIEKEKEWIMHLSRYKKQDPHIMFNRESTRGRLHRMYVEADSLIEVLIRKVSH